MRRVRHFRELATGEKQVARLVFKERLPYDKIMISDGLGGGDRPFTVPTSLKISVLFNVSRGKYVIHAGDGYYGMSKLKDDKETLVHELTHVWQGEYRNHSWDYVLDSLWHQALSEDAYKYNKSYYQNWDDYNAEQQAQIVEDWFKSGMKTGEYEDIRFYYIKKYIRGENIDHDWIAASHQIKPLEAGRLDVPVAYPSIDFDYYLVPILKKRYRADDEAGFKGRVKELEEFFQRLDATNASKLLIRLQTRKSGDKVSEYFHDHLHHATRARLLRILRGDRG